MANSFAHVPVMIFSLLNSIAGETTAFAKPVIGTSVPAPQCWAILSYTPTAVRVADRPMSVTLTKPRACVSGSPAARYSPSSAWPRQQIAPPETYAKTRFLRNGEPGEAFFVIS